MRVRYPTVVGTRTALRKAAGSLAYRARHPHEFVECVALTGGGSARFLCGSRLELARIRGGMDELGHAEALARDLREGDVFWDVGANIGLYACVALVASRVGVVHAFEPAGFVAERLRRNVAFNDADGGAWGRGAVHELALSSDEGVVRFYERRAFGSGVHSMIGAHGPLRSGRDRAVRRVRAVTAESVVRRYGVSRPTVVKIDVEGAEGRVLAGLLPMVGGWGVRRMDIEFHPETLAADGFTEAGLRRDVEGAGFREVWSSARGVTSMVTYVRG